MNRRAPAVARVVADFTTDGRVKDTVAEPGRRQPRFNQFGVGRLVSLPASRAEQPDQPLREHAVERRNEIIRLDAHIDKAPDDVNDVIGVNGGEDQVARERGVDGDLRGLLVADFADHDLVGVVAQDAAQAPRERQPLLLVDLNLGDAAQLVLDRVLDREDLVLVVADFVQRGVQGRRLPRTRRPGDQHHPVRLADEAAERGQQIRFESDDFQFKVFELFVDLLLVEDADHRVFAVDRGHDRNAEVDAPALNAHAETPVLRDAALGDVEFGHDLDARDDRLMMADVYGVARLVERAVDAVAHDHVGVSRLEVDVGGAFFERGEDDGVYELDDRRHLVAREAVQVENLFALLGLLDQRGAEALGRLLEDALRRVALAQNGLDRAPRRHLDLEGDAQLGLQLVEQHEVRRVGHGYDHVSVVAAHRHELVPQHQVHRERLHERIIHRVIFQRDEIQAIALGQRYGRIALGPSVLSVVLSVYDALF